MQTPFVFTPQIRALTPTAQAASSGFRSPWGVPVALLMCAALLASGCSSTRVAAPAPVEDRHTGVGTPPAPVSVAVAPVATGGPATPLPPGAENAGKPGYYTVKPGDSLIRIAMESGQNWRDVARWNGLENPNRIEVGQVLRVIPPAPVVAASGGATAASPAATSPAGSGVSTAPVTSSAAISPRPLNSGGAPATPAPVSKPGDEGLTFIWPAGGTVVAEFDEQKNKGLGIMGKAGDPVMAAADGQVVYAGSGLRGYGNLIILKHNSTFITAYAHNQSLLVKEGQTVKQGQKIAEMGSSDADRVKLHFEIRRDGKPVDPAKLLPAR
jgi:lipoprotein NlpD